MCDAYHPDAFAPLEYRTPDLLSGLPKSTPLLLGFSGGVDSSVLLDLTARYAREHGAPLRILHMHHGIRGEEADRDARFAAKTAERYGIPLITVFRDIPKIARETGESIEEAARRERYLAFEAAMREYEIPILLTAHNASDQLETVLFRILRGSGLSGLCGIPAVRDLRYGMVVRPLLSVSRRDIEAYADAHHIPYVVDSTNADTAYARNRLRLSVVPTLRSLTDSPEKSVSRMVDSLRRDRDFLDRLASELLDRADTGDGLDRSVLCRADDAVLIRTLFLYWRREIPDLDSYEALHLEALLSFVKNGKCGTHLSLRKSTAALDTDRLRITESRLSQTRQSLPAAEIPLAEGETKLPGTDIFFTLSRLSEENPIIFRNPSINPREIAKNIYNSATQIAFSFDTINGWAQKPLLSVRRRLPGDRILTRGMHRSLRTLLNAAHLSREQRETLCVVTCGDEILWIPGIAVRDGIAPRDGEQGYLLSVSRIPFP
jgi:tRNA(Ile)-lysidine synthase